MKFNLEFRSSKDCLIVGVMQCTHACAYIIYVYKKIHVYIRKFRLSKHCGKTNPMINI